MALPLLVRRQSYDRIPQFFFPICTANEAQGRTICQNRVLERIDALLLTPDLLDKLLCCICEYARPPSLSNYQKAMLSKVARSSGIVIIDRLQLDASSIMLHYGDVKTIVDRTASDIVRNLLSAQVFLMFPPNQDGCINGCSLLEFVLHLQRTLTATKFLCQQETISMTSTLPEGEVAKLVRELIADAITHNHITLDRSFRSYYEIICTRKILLQHDLLANRSQLAVDDLLACPCFLQFFQLVSPELQAHFVTESNAFSPSAIRLVHQEYAQLDRDRNGMLSVEEVLAYGKKKAFNPINRTPTHDLTRAFVNQVFAETATFPPHGEMDYKSYIDFTLTMADHSSPIALRYFWKILDFQKQGFLDAFTLDFFLRDLIEKIREHNDDDSITPARLRTQVFDLVAPKDPLRITLKDIQNSKLGHLVVRLLTDYVAYQRYENCDGRFAPE